MTAQHHATTERVRHSETGERSPSIFQRVRRAWQAFRDDPPGHRFRNHLKRMREAGSARLRALCLGLGVLLLAGGVVLLFVPGPGLVAIVFGMALLAGESRALARQMDRAEPHVRRWHAGLHRWWGRRGWPARIALIAVGLALGAGALFVGYLWLTR